jgi:hypothetical protein
MSRQRFYGPLAPTVVLDPSADDRADLPVEVDELDVYGAGRALPGCRDELDDLVEGGL